jgi:hypothetical protein
MGEEEGLAIGIEAQRLEVRTADSLEDQIDVGPVTFDHREVHENEQDVVVTGNETRARWQRGR